MHRWMRTVVYITIIGLGLSGTPVSFAQTQIQPSMYATSAAVDMLGNTYIVLYWTKAEGVAGYNLYRKEGAAPDYPAMPINGEKTISQVGSCAELKTFLAEDSPEWNALNDAFAAMEESGDFRNRLLSRDQVPLRPQFGIKTPKFPPGVRPDRVCTAFDRGLSPKEQEIFDLLATVNLKIRLARGWAFIDRAVQRDKAYFYALKGVKAGRREIDLISGVRVIAGRYRLPAPPANVAGTAGDRVALITWTRNNAAFGYHVSRATSASGTYQVVSSEPIIFDVTEDLGDNPISPSPGFVDYQRWSDDGLPISHDVNGVSIDGPENYRTYYYKVASIDILGRRGDWSTIYATAMPIDQTPPEAPKMVKIDAMLTGLTLSWERVTRDVKGHKELDTTQTYNIYRADTLEKLDNLSTLNSYLVRSISANPTVTGSDTLSWTDTASVIFPLEGEKDFWYRIQVSDAHNNKGAPSAAVAGRIPDKIPPGPTKITGSEGFADRIRIIWEPNRATDLAGYQVYRGVCNDGQPYQKKKGREKYSCYFVLVGEITADEAEKRLHGVGIIYYDDYSVPAGSPMCYAYWVRAFDKAGNVYSAQYNCPDAETYICQRLYEKTAPPFPVISGVKARSNSVLIEWVSSPVQDLRAFHVYRSKNERDTPTFVGTVFTDGTTSPSKWPGIEPKCDEIPASVNPSAIKGSFLDKDVIPWEIYWYRVSAVDWLGNESEREHIEKIPAISTFTYTREVSPTPVVLAHAGGESGSCGLIVKWNPTFDSALMDGFLVFRSKAENGKYHQVSGLVTGNKFEDKSALRSTDYWYRVQVMGKDGTLSEPSAPVKHRY